MTDAPVQRPVPRWSVCLLLVALAAAAYAPVRRFGFVRYDDPVLIVDEPHIAVGLTADSVRWALTSCDQGPWVPLARLSYLLDRQLLGLDPGRMHVENVALHAAAGVLLFLSLAEATGRAGRSAVVAAVFLVHPTHVESVAWLSERRDVLSTALLMGAVWAYVRHVRTGRWPPYMAAVALYALSLLAKAMGMTLPILLLLLDVWPLRRPWTRRLLWDKVPFALVAVPAAVMAVVGQRSANAMSTLTQWPVTARVANVLVTTVLYVAQAVAPVRLSPVYLPPPGGWSAGQVVAAAGLIGLAAAIAVRLRRRRPYVAIGLAWFVIALAPVSGAAQTGHQSMADRYSYLPSVGLAVVAVWAAADVAVLPKRLAAVAVVVALTVACRRQVGYWADDVTLFTHAADVTDGNWVAFNALGQDAAAAHDYAAAALWFKRAIDANPNCGDANDGLGNCLYRVDPARSLPYYEAAVRCDPRSARSLANLGNALSAIGRRAEARAAYAKSLAINPANAAVRRQLDTVARP